MNVDPIYHVLLNLEVERESDRTMKSKKVNWDEDKWEPSTLSHIFL